MLDVRSPNNPLAKAVQIIDPLNGQPFAGNLIPAARLDPVALNLMPYLPQAGGNGRVAYSLPLHQDFNEGLVKVDHSISNADRLSFRYFLDDFANTSSYDGKNLLTLNNYSAIRAQNVSVYDTHIFSPNALDTFHLTYAREKSNRGQPDTVPNMRDLGVANVFQSQQKALERIQLSGFFTVGANPYAEFVRNNFSFDDQFRW